MGYLQNLLSKGDAGIVEILVETQIDELNQPPALHINDRTAVIISLRLMVLTVELEEDTIIAVTVIRVVTVDCQYMLIMRLGSGLCIKQHSHCHSKHIK